MLEIDFSSQDLDSIYTLAIKKAEAKSVESWEKLIWQFIAWFTESKIETIEVYSSGSTGIPRKIIHTKQAMANSARMTCKALELEPGSNALLCLPADKIGGMMMIVRSLINKMNLYCIKPSVHPLNELTDDSRIDFAAFTPMQFQDIIKDDQNFLKAGKIGNIILGGQDIDSALLHRISTMPNKINATFGMTETISHIALKKLSGENVNAHYKVLSGIWVEADERNCLIIEAPELGQPHLVTNDIVQIVSQNEFDWLGRIDNVINSGGIKIYPEEVEQKISSAIHYPFFIAGISDNISGQKVGIALEAVNIDANEVENLKHVFSSLIKIRRPKEIMLIEHFVRTENGKVKRKESLDKVIKAIVI